VADALVPRAARGVDLHLEQLDEAAAAGEDALALEERLAGGSIVDPHPIMIDTPSSVSVRAYRTPPLRTVREAERSTTWHVSPVSARLSWQALGAVV